MIIDNQETDFLVCNTCGDQQLIKYDTKLGAAAVNKHVNHHTTSNTGSQSTQISMECYTKRKVSNKDKSMMADAAALCCAIDFRPFAMIEGKGLRNLIQTAINIGSKRGQIEASEIVPSADAVRKHLDNVYDSAKELLIEHLKDIDSINLTTDHWTDKFSGTNYMTITISYFNNKESKLMNRVIATFKVKDKKSNTTIDNFVTQLSNLDIQSKTRIIVTDNASNMSSAFKNYIWVGCTAHNLALAQKYSFAMDKKSFPLNPNPAIKLLIESTKRLVRTVKAGSINTELETRLKQEVETRWDTYCDMFESVLDNFESLKKYPSLNADFIKINRGLLEEIVTLLKPLKKLRMEMSKDEKPTFHLVTMSYDAIIDMMKPKPSDNDAIKIVKNRFKYYMNLKYKVTEYHVMATYLCPAFRRYKFSNEPLVTRAHETLAMLLQECPESDDESTTIHLNGQLNENTSNCNSIFDKYMDVERRNDSNCEIERYKSMSFTDTDIKMCPLLFWSNQQKSFPKISKLALWLLAAPATNSSSERSFSAAGNTITHHRNSLFPITVEKQLFVRSNRDLL